MIEELRSPGAHRDDIDQNIPVEFAAVQQMRPQRRRSTHVMGNDHGPIEVPMRKHLGEHFSLNIERRALLRDFGGSAVSGHVVPVDMILQCKIRNNPMP
jgi:hypothetical protein